MKYLSLFGVLLVNTTKSKGVSKPDEACKYNQWKRHMYEYNVLILILLIMYK